MYNFLYKLIGHNNKTKFKYYKHPKKGMKCSKCGNKLTKEDEFCPDCGKKVPKFRKKVKRKKEKSTYKTRKTKEPGKIVRCLNCGVESRSIIENLECAKCKEKYVCDKKHDLYLLKDTKCEKCHQISKTIATKHFCDKCGAKYVYDKGNWWRPEGYYLKSKVYIYDKFYCSGFIGDIWIFVIAVCFAIMLIFSRGGQAKIFSLIPLAVAAYMGYKIFKRLKKSGFSFEKLIGVSQEK